MINTAVMKPHRPWMTPQSTDRWRGLKKVDTRTVEGFFLSSIIITFGVFTDACNVHGRRQPGFQAALGPGRIS